MELYLLILNGTREESGKKKFSEKSYFFFSVKTKNRFSDVRAKPDYTVLFQIEPNEFATTIANLTLAPVNQKLIADAEPYHGTYTDETQTYSYFSACWSCYAKTAKPRVPLAVVKLDFSNPKQYSAQNEYVEDLLDKFPPAANVVVASSG